MDDNSGESMELMEEVPLKELGNAELERLAGSWFQTRREAYWKERSVIRREDDVDACFIRSSLHDLGCLSRTKYMHCG